MNDTYLRTWDSIPPQSPNPLVSYVCKIARNLAINRYHANRAEKRNRGFDLILDEMEECIPSGVNVETELEAKELSVAINSFYTLLTTRIVSFLYAGTGMRIQFLICQQ